LSDTILHNLSPKTAKDSASQLLQLLNALTDGRPFSVMMAPVTVDRQAAALLLQAKPPRHLRGLYEATRDFAIGLVMVSQGSFEFTRPSGRPSVIMIGDDDALCSMGPDGFDEESVRSALKDSAFVGIVASGPVPLIYNTAATCAARDRRNAVIIDTCIEHKDVWHALVQEVAPDASVAVSVPMENQ
jgi:hypothetical protein